MSVKVCSVPLTRIGWTPIAESGFDRWGCEASKQLARERMLNARFRRTVLAFDKRDARAVRGRPIYEIGEFVRGDA